MFKKIAIVGVGLIGGSVGLAVRKKRLAKAVVGICRRRSSAQKAVMARAVESVTLDMKKGLQGADLVLIAAPIGKTILLAKKCSRYMERGAILTDVASAKNKIVQKIEKGIPGKVKFVGTHPMAGRETSGVKCAHHDLFKDAPVVIVRTKRTDKRALSKVKRFWIALGAKTFVLSPDRHDRLVSLISHLPHAASALLVLSQDKNSLKFSAGGFKDITRISSSDPGMWADIFLAADKDLLKSLSGFSRRLKAFEKAVKKKDRKALISLLKKAKKTRDSL